jgi:hypothetical protein
MTANKRPFKERVLDTDALLKGKKVYLTERVGVALRETCNNTATDY